MVERTGFFLPLLFITLRTSRAMELSLLVVVATTCAIVKAVLCLTSLSKHRILRTLHFYYSFVLLFSVCILAQLLKSVQCFLATLPTS